MREIGLIVLLWLLSQYDYTQNAFLAGPVLAVSFGAFIYLCMCLVDRFMKKDETHRIDFNAPYLDYIDEEENNSLLSSNVNYSKPKDEQPYALDAVNVPEPDSKPERKIKIGSN